MALFYSLFYSGCLKRCSCNMRNRDIISRITNWSANAFHDKCMFRWLFFLFFIKQENVIFVYDKTLAFTWIIIWIINLMIYSKSLFFNFFIIKTKITESHIYTWHFHWKVPLLYIFVTISSNENVRNVLISKYFANSCNFIK